MKTKVGNIGLQSYDDLFKNDEIRSDDRAEKVLHISLSELYEPAIHPFRVLDDDAMQEMAESIRASGVMVPGIARPRSEGGYELISGNRRRRASELAGKDTMPVIIRDMNDDEAIIALVDANLQRETILPSEKAQAYKLKMDALKRQGQRTDITSRQIGEKLWSVDQVSENSNDSARQIHRFIRLTELKPELLDLVDEKKIPFNTAVDISYLPENEQDSLITIMDRDECVPSGSQAKRLKQFSQQGKLNNESLEAIMTEEKPIEDKVVLRRKDYGKYVPQSYTPRQIEEYIIKALDYYDRKIKRDRETER